MRMKKLLSATAVILAFGPRTSNAGNQVTVESRVVSPGDTGVVVGVYLENDVTASGVCLPFVIRSIDSGAHIQDQLVASAAGRLDAMVDSGSFQWFSYYSMTGRYDRPHNCGPDSIWSPGDSAIDFVSPDAMIAVVVGYGDGAYLYPGSDGIPDFGAPSLLLRFNVTATEGRFEIDTTCVPQGNHLSYLHGEMGGDELSPTFTKGTIEIVDSCGCDCHGDPVCDGVLTILDYLKVQGVAYNGQPQVVDPNPFCPREDTDLDCNGYTNAIDVAKMRNVVFYAHDPCTEFCRPCGGDCPW